MQEVAGSSPALITEVGSVNPIGENPKPRHGDELASTSQDHRNSCSGRHTYLPKPIPGTDSIVPDTFPAEWAEGALAVA